MALFEGFDGAHGTHGKMERNPEKHGKMEIKKSAKTVREPVTLELWESHVAGDHPIGIIPIRRDSTCIWGCIDVDKYDMDLGEVVRRIKEMELPLLLCRTKSGGAHLYLFLSEAVPPEELRAKLNDLAALLGYGGSEIFPKQNAILWDSHDLGNWLNMPYFSAEQTERYCIGENGRGLTLRQFLTLAESRRQTYEQMCALSAPAKENKEFKDGPPCLQHLTATGFPEGTRNNGLFALGTFLKRKHPDKWDKMLEDLNQQYFDPPLPSPEVQQVLKSLKGKDYRYKCSDMPLASHCNAGLCRTRKYGVGGAGALPTISNLAMLDTDEPIWFLDVEGDRVEMTTDDLLNPMRFQKVVLESCKKLLPVLKRETWNNIIMGLQADMTVIEAPPEISLTGQFLEHLETFCTDRQKAREIDEIILGKAWHDEAQGKIFFRMRDIQEYLDKVKFRGLTRSQMATRIRDNSGGTAFFNVKGRGVNVFWVPAKMFSVQTEQHDIPNVKEEVV